MHSVEVQSNEDRKVQMDISKHLEMAPCSAPGE